LTPDYYVIKALKSSEFAYNHPREFKDVPPAKFCIPVKAPFAEPEYDAREMYKRGEVEPVKTEDGSPVKWVKLTPKFFAKHGLEFTSDGQQVKPSTETLKTFLKGITTERQRQNGVTINTEGDTPYTITAELVRVGIAETDGAKSIKIPPETFRQLGLTDSAETPSTSEASIA
jgi:hypothetical protein